MASEISRYYIGVFGGHPVYYYPELDYLLCKNQKCKFSNLEESINNSIDRQIIKETDLLVLKDYDIVSIGCLKDTRETYNKLKNNIKNILNYVKNDS